MKDDCQQVIMYLDKLDEMKVDLPNSVIWVRANCSLKGGEFQETMNQLEKYLKVTDNKPKNYSITIAMYNKAKANHKLVQSGTWLRDADTGCYTFLTVKKINVWRGRNITWSGPCPDGLAHGQGTYTLSNGYKYVGQYKDGKVHGQGTMTWPNGDKYVGQTKEGKIDGQGTYTWPSGGKYVGQWKDGLEHGQGTYFYSNGTSKVGRWQNGQYIGK